MGKVRELRGGRATIASVAAEVGIPAGSVRTALAGAPAPVEPTEGTGAGAPARPGPRHEERALARAGLLQGAPLVTCRRRQPGPGRAGPGRGTSSSCRRWRSPPGGRRRGGARLAQGGVGARCARCCWCVCSQRRVRARTRRGPPSSEARDHSLVLDEGRAVGANVRLADGVTTRDGGRPAQFHPAGGASILHPAMLRTDAGPPVNVTVFGGLSRAGSRRALRRRSARMRGSTV